MELEQTFSPTPDGARAARHFVQAALGDLDPGVCHVTMLLTSELATNAILHAGTDFVVAVSHPGDALRVAVSDGNTRLPQSCMAPADAPTGRGLALVDALASAWGADRHGQGKTVWFEVRPLSGPA
jgi:anti-sigma regulatory factor (Ser/Thr protein kinase)